MDFELLLAMLAFTLPISILPGPNNLLSASHSSRYGFRETLPLLSGMVFGWFLLGISVGFGALFIEENKNLLNALTYIGVGYIVYLSYKIATARLVDGEEAADEKLGLSTGAALQIVNGKAFIHLLILKHQCIQKYECFHPSTQKVIKYRNKHISKIQYTNL